LKIAALYQPVAILDSQTTDSQWADKLDDPASQYWPQESQVPIKEEVEEVEESLAVAEETFSPPSNSPSPPLSVEQTAMEEIKSLIELAVMDDIKSRIDKIVDIRCREVQDERDSLIVIINVMTEELESINQENVSVAARRDILLEELDLERRWIRALECTLKDNRITLPKYPKRM